jgi:hypothetical protein
MVLGMCGKCSVQLRLEASDGPLHGDNDLHESGGRQPHCPLNATWVVQGGRLEHGNERVGEAWTVAASTTP